jgi:voltage-gated potassium channel
MAVESSYEARVFGRPVSGWRRRWFNVIFESDTPAGRRFDALVLSLVAISVLVVMLETVDSIAAPYEGSLFALEWVFTLLFTVEYAARLATVERPVRYAVSFFGLVDLASVLPMYLALFFPGLHVLIDVRILRLLRVFRILKMTEYVKEYSSLGAALYASRRKVAVFLSAVAMVVVVLGTVLYAVEGPENGFTSIPVAVYWSITTMTTVGFGDITPKTGFGRAISSVVMLLGWGILAVPTGIVTAEMTSRRLSADVGTRRCPSCGAPVFFGAARYCHHCGRSLPDAPADQRS